MNFKTRIVFNINIWFTFHMFHHI